MAIKNITDEVKNLRAIEETAREAWPSLLGYGVLWDDRIAISKGLKLRNACAANGDARAQRAIEAETEVNQPTE